MKLHEFLESSYVSTNLQLQQEYSSFKKGRTLACQKLIHLQVHIGRILSYPVLFWEFLMLKLGFNEAPETALLLVNNAKEGMKRDEEAKKAEAESKKPKLVEAPTTI